MNHEQAIQLIHKLHTEKLANTEIAARLEKMGYKSPRTGQPIQPQTVGWHLRNSKPSASSVSEVSAAPRPTPTTPQHRRQAKNPTESKLELVQAFLASKDIALKDKCEIAATILLS